MKTQFDHILQSSFYLWFEYQLGVVGEAYRTIDINFVGGPEGPSVPGNDLTFSSNIPEGMAAYHSPYRQFLALEDVLPDTEFGTPPNPARFRKRLKINGADYFEYPDAINGKDQIIIDYNNGRVLLDKNTFGLNAQVKGNFNVKTFNSYLTSEDEESVLINSDFLLQNASLQTYLESKSKLGDKSYTIPAGFITTSKSRNDPFAFGGLDETVSTISVVIVANTNYELDFALSLFRDSAFSNFPVVPYERFPYGEYFGLKPTSRPYKYREFCETCNEKAYIKSVGSSKLSDKSNRKISKDLKVGFIDFDISSVRNPRAALAPPVVVSVGDLFESCVEPTPSKTPSLSRTESPSNSTTASVTYIPPAPWLDSFCLRGTGNVWNTPPQIALKNHLEGTYEIEQANADLEKVITIIKQVIGDPGATQKHETWSRHGGIGENAGVSMLYLESSINFALSGWYFILNNSQSQTTTPTDLAFQSFQNEHVQVPWNVSWYLDDDGNWSEWHLTPGVACATPTSTSSNSVSQTPSSSAILGDLFGYCATPTDTPFIAAPTPTATKSPYATPTWSATLPPGDEFDICKPDTPTSSASISVPEIKDLCVNISQVTMEDQNRMLGQSEEDFPLYKLPKISDNQSPHIYGIGDNEFPNFEGAAFNGIFGAGVSNPNNGAWTAWKDNAPSVQGKTGIRIAWDSIPISTFIAKYSIYRIDYSAVPGTKGQYDPKDWKIEASDDGITWSVIQEKNGQALQDGRNDYDIYTQKPYSHYRINVSDNNGGDYTSIAELEFYEPNPQREIQVMVGKLSRKRFEYAFHSNGLEFYKSVDKISSDTGEVDITASGAYSQLRSILGGKTPTFYNGYAYYVNMAAGVVFAFADLYLYKTQKESTLIKFTISSLGDQPVQIPFWSPDGQSHSADYWQRIPFHGYVAPRSSVDFGVCGTPSVSLSPPPASPTSTRTSSPTKTNTTSASLTPDAIATASETDCPQIDYNAGLDADWCEQNYVMVNTGSGTGWGPGWSPNEASTFDSTKGVFSSLTIKWLGVNPYTGAASGTNNTKFIGPETFVAAAETWDATAHNGLPGKSGQYGLYKSTSSCDQLLLFNSGNSGSKYHLLTQQCPVATTTVTASPSFSATVTSTPSISTNISQESCEKMTLHTQYQFESFTEIYNHADPSEKVSQYSLHHDDSRKLFDKPSLKFDDGSRLTFNESVTDFESGEDFTIEFWSYREENMTPSEAIIGNHFTEPNAEQENRWRIMYDWQSNNGWTFIYSRSEWISSENTSLNEWHHIAITRKDNKISLYIDGVLKGSENGISKAMSAHSGGTGTVTMGRIASGHGSNYAGFKGNIQDFRITKEAIYSGEFAAPSQLHEVCPGNSLSFDGGSDYVKLNALKYLTQSNTPGKFSLSIWFKPLEYGLNLLGMSDAWAAGINQYLYINPSGNIKLSGWGGTGGAATFTSTKVKLGEWNHLVLTKSLTHKLKAYLNGYLIGEEEFNQPYGFDQIGKFYNSNTYNFKGLIDEIITWKDIELTEVMAKSLFCNFSEHYNNKLLSILYSTPYQWFRMGEYVSGETMPDSGSANTTAIIHGPIVSTEPYTQDLCKDSDSTPTTRTFGFVAMTAGDHLSLDGEDRNGPTIPNYTPTVNINVGDTINIQNRTSGRRFYIRSSLVGGCAWAEDCDQVDNPAATNNGSIGVWASNWPTVSWTPSAAGTYYYLAVRGNHSNPGSVATGQIIVSMPTPSPTTPHFSIYSHQDSDGSVEHFDEDPISGITIEKSGTVQHSTYQPIENSNAPNSSSVYFEGTSNGGYDYLKTQATSFRFEEDFSMRAWIKRQDNTKDDYILSLYNAAYSGFHLYGKSNGKIGFQGGDANSGFTNSWEIELESDSVIAQGTWAHVKVVRKDNKVSLYVNNSLEDSTTSTAAIGSSSNSLTIGIAAWNHTSYGFKGYMNAIELFDSACEPICYHHWS